MGLGLVVGVGMRRPHLVETIDAGQEIEEEQAEQREQQAGHAKNTLNGAGGYGQDPRQAAPGAGEAGDRLRRISFYEAVATSINLRMPALALPPPNSRTYCQ